MKLGQFFKSLMGESAANVDADAEKYVRYQKSSAEGKLASSVPRVSVVTIDPALRGELTIRLAPFVKKAGYVYDDQPGMTTATHSQIVILDATPHADARLHAQYDKILRIKKSMGKRADILCLIGRREDHKRYPRGTYPRLLFFCVNEGDYNRRDADLPVQGADTIIGPRLYNFADMPAAILGRIREITGEKD